MLYHVQSNHYHWFLVSGKKSRTPSNKPSVQPKKEQAPEVKKELPKDCLSEMIKLGEDGKLPEMSTLNERIAKLEERMKTKVRDCLGFGTVSDGLLKVWTDKHGYGCSFIGERNSNNKLHGRGIWINEYGLVNVGYFNDGEIAPGNYIYFSSNGKFRVGQCYLGKKGEREWMYTEYFTDGTTKMVGY